MDDSSRTCTQDAGGDYCGAYRAQDLVLKEKKKEKIQHKMEK